MTNPPNTMLLAKGSYTSLAMSLNWAMELDPAAQLAYREVWGIDWEPLPTPGLAQPELTLSPVTVVAPPISTARVILEHIAAFVEQHGRLVRIEEEHVVVAEPWIHPVTGEAGEEHHWVQTMAEAREALGY